MTGGVDHVNGDFFPLGVRAGVGDGGVLGKNCDAFFFFQVARVHRAIGSGGVGRKSTRLGEHRIDQGSFTVVYVSNDGDVSHIIASGMSHESVLKGLGGAETINPSPAPLSYRALSLGL